MDDLLLTIEPFSQYNPLSSPCSIFLEVGMLKTVDFIGTSAFVQFSVNIWNERNRHLHVSKIELVISPFGDDVKMTISFMEEDDETLKKNDEI